MLFLILALVSGFQDPPLPSSDAGADGIAAAVQSGAISNPRWERQPGWSARQGVFHRFPQGGQVALSCAVAADGRLENCTVVSETIPTSGWAAMRLIPGFQLAMEGEGAAIAGRRVQFSIRWASDEDQ